MNHVGFPNNMVCSNSEPAMGWHSYFPPYLLTTDVDGSSEAAASTGVYRFA